jgi:NAD(P)-dependent dehydrogenase (short-subunit alcohol dehydrogenase family)
MSGIRLTRHYVAGMRDRGWGRVQFMASDSAVVIPEEMVHYGVTKTALLGVSRGFAKVVAGSGVTVNAVIAGPTHTEGVEDFVREHRPTSTSSCEWSQKVALRPFVTTRGQIAAS